MAPLRNDDTGVASRGRPLTVGFAAFFLLFFCACSKPQQKGGSPADVPRILITQRTQTGGFLAGEAPINSADAVAAKITGMEIVAFISTTQTKEPILAAINGDVGPKAGEKKPYIRIWYNDSHGGGDENYVFEGPLIPKSNPNPNVKADDHMAPNEIKRPDNIQGLPVGHPGYLLVFFNSCRGDVRHAEWRSALSGTLSTPEYLCWTIDTPGKAYDVGVLFGEAVAAYFRLSRSAEPPTGSLGRFVKNYIIDHTKEDYPDIGNTLKLVPE
jgi:hypothetical protein